MAALNHSPAKILADLLVSLGFGVAAPASSGWPVYVGSEPTSPDEVITIYDTAGVTNGRDMVVGERSEHRGLQLRFRAGDYLTGYVKASAVADALDKQTGKVTVTIGATTYTIWTVVRRSDVISLGRKVDKSQRDVFVLNATISVDP